MRGPTNGTPGRNRTEANRGPKHSATWRVDGSGFDHSVLDEMGGRSRRCSSDTCCSDCRNTAFHASPRQIIRTATKVIADNVHERHTDTAADTISVPDRIRHSVTDTFRGIHASTDTDKVSTASAVIISHGGNKQ